MKKLVAVAAVVLVAWLLWRAWPSASPRNSATPAGAETPRSELASTTDGSEPSAPRDAAHAERAQVETPAETTATAAKETVPVVRLVDERTGEPVAHFELELECAGLEPTHVRSDAAGRVELPARVDTQLHLSENEAGSDRIQTRSEALSKLPRSVAVAKDALGSTVLDVRIPVGPTYRLSFALPPAHASSDMSLTLRSADPRMAFDSAFADLRDERAPWARFRPTALYVSGGPPWKLELASRDGLWFGAAEVASNQGLQPDAVRIELEPRACLQGTLRDDANSAIANEYVRIERDGAAFTSTTNRPLFGLTGADGRYAIRGVPPGEYVAKCRVENHLDVESKVVLVAGEALQLDLVAARLPEQELTRVEGRVESDSGTFRERLYVFATPQPHATGTRRSDVAWRTLDGRALGEFAFDLPAGSYRVRVQGNRLVEVEPLELTWQAGSPSPAFRVHDSAARGQLRFRAIDPRDGSEVSNFRVRVTLAGATGTLTDEVVTSTGLVTVENVPFGAQCEFRALADERQSVWGTCAASEESAAPIEVHLAPGWGTEVFATDDRGAPLAGVRVLFDGEVRGETDERGRLRVAVDHTPQTVHFERDGWKPVERGDYSPETGRFRSWQPWITIALERR